MKALVLISGLCVLAACGDNSKAPPIAYIDPPPGGALRLVKDPATTADTVVLDLVVGDAPLTGYSAGFDLPLAPGMVVVGTFTPGTALEVGSGAVAGGAAIPTTGALANQLVVAISQKRTSSPGDTVLQPGAVLLKVEVKAVSPAVPGVVFDGQAKEFVLRSGGLRALSGMTVVAPGQVQIGRLETFD